MLERALLVCTSKGLTADMEMSDLSAFTGPRITVSIDASDRSEGKSHIKIKTLHKMCRG